MYSQTKNAKKQKNKNRARKRIKQVKFENGKTKAKQLKPSKPQNRSEPKVLKQRTIAEVCIEAANANK